MLDSYLRYQVGLSMNMLFPDSPERKCACGCGNLLPKGKRRWFSTECKTKALYEFYVVKGDIQVIRFLLYKTDRGGCRMCGEVTQDWEADHILPVFMGGGGCTLDNFQTLCKSCHLEKSKLSYTIPNVEALKQ